MKKLYACLLSLAFALPFSAGALTFEVEDISSEFNAYSTVRYGTQTESVYQTVNGSQKLLSFLTWDQKSLIDFRADLKAYIKNFYVSGGFDYALPLSCGIVCDSDWNNITYTDAVIAAYKTNYSESECVNNTDYTVHAELGYVFSNHPVVSAVPFAGFDYEYSLYSAQNGTYWYGNGSGSYKYQYNDTDSSHVSTGTFTGTVMTLERIRYTAWAGLRWNVKAAPWLKVNAMFALSPYTQIKSLDSHLKRSPALYFYDVMSGCFSGVKASLDAEYCLTKNHSLGACVYGEFISVYGISYSGYSKSSVSLIDTTSGASVYNIQTSFFYKWHLR